MTTSKAYAMGWLCFLALPAFAWYLATLGPLRALAFGLVAPEPVYLANLREPELACRTLALRRADVVVLGDSHSYAAWDFAELERRLQQRVGACSPGGLYAESVPGLLQYAIATSPDAKRVILGLSPRMFWESPTKQEQLDFHVYLFKTLSPDVVPFIRRAFLRKALPHDDEAQAIRRHEARIEALNEAAIAARLDRSRQTIRTLRDWNDRLKDVRFAPGFDAIAQDICAKVRAANLHLWVLHVPESPYLEARYSKETWDRYRHAVNALKPCAEKILLDEARTYGLGNRHYVNRQLKDEHEYTGWGLSTPISDDLAFDADHLNPVGARLFTRNVLDRLGLAKP